MPSFAILATFSFWRPLMAFVCLYFHCWKAAFGDRWQQANSGVLVFEPTATVGAFYHALAARLQGQEILVRLLPYLDSVAFEQLLLNYMLQQTRTLAKSFNTVRWGIYSPLVAYSGMFLTAAVLTGTTVHHATASNADLKRKLQLMAAWCKKLPTAEMRFHQAFVGKTRKRQSNLDET